MKTEASIFSFKWKDALKAFIVAVITAVLTTLLTMLQSPTHEINWETVGYTALTTAIAYLLKNFLTNSDDKFLKSENKSKIES